MKDEFSNRLTMFQTARDLIAEYKEARIIRDAGHGAKKKPVVVTPPVTPQ